MVSLFAAAAAFFCLPANAPAAPSVHPTGVTLYNPQKAYNSYVLFTGGDRITRLIDMNGNVVHEWKYVGFPGVFLDPQLVGGTRGHVLLTLKSIDGAGTGLIPGQASYEISQSVGELDWNGNVVWKWGDAQAPGGAAQQHHDWRRLPNGDTLILANWLHAVPGFAQPKVLDDVIYEVAPNGKIVWQWIAADHLDEFGYTPAELNLVKATKNPDYLHANDIAVVGPNRWYAAGDKRFAPDNVLINFRNANLALLIDKRTGNVVWRLGPDYSPLPPVTERHVPRPLDQISGEHDVHFIPEGLPGAGDVLVFDNQGEGGYPPVRLSVTEGSRVVEINPVTKQIVWEYDGESSGGPGWSFLSTFISSARRLPNGNTLIDEGYDGRFFQVTLEGEIVWEYVSPYVGWLYGNVPGASHTIPSNWVYRAQPVPYDWVPAGTPHSEKSVVAPALPGFHVPGSR
jgi:hypothetical protein